MFSGFWALQIFAAKLAFNAGVEVLSFQLLSYSVVLIILAVVLLGKRCSGSCLVLIASRQV